MRVSPGSNLIIIACPSTHFVAPAQTLTFHSTSSEFDFCSLLLFFHFWILLLCFTLIFTFDFTFWVLLFTLNFTHFVAPAQTLTPHSAPFEFNFVVFYFCILRFTFSFYFNFSLLFSARTKINPAYNPIWF